MTDAEFVAMRLREAAATVRRPSRWRRFFHAPSGRPREVMIAGGGDDGHIAAAHSRISRADDDIR